MIKEQNKHLLYSFFLFQIIFFSSGKFFNDSTSVQNVLVKSFIMPD